MANAPMFDAAALVDLVHIGRTGSFSAAARERRVAVSTVMRRLDTLEHAAGLRLVDRGARGARLTEAGQAIAGLGEPLANQLARIERTAEALRSGARSAPVRISATESVIVDVLAPALPKLMTQQPGLCIQLQSEASVVSLAGRQADLALRMSRPAGASLYVRKVADIPLGLFASAAYLAGRDPAAIDLKAERLLGFDDSYGAIPETEWFRSRKLDEHLVLRTASTRGLVAAAVAGAGIALLPRRQASDAGLVAVGGGSAIPARAAWLAVHRDLRGDPQIRAVGRWIEATFAELYR